MDCVAQSYTEGGQYVYWTPVARCGQSGEGRRPGRGLFDFLAVLFLTNYLSRPLHLFGPVGIVIFIGDTLINLYLTTIWAMGQAIGHRPLLILGLLSMLVGLQFISVGLLGEMIRHYTYHLEAEYSIRKVWHKD